MSHHAIDNLTQAVVERFAEEGDTLRAVRKAPGGPVAGVTYLNDNKRCATGEYDVLAGTAWLFASQAMRDNPVDVLVVDEAGQLGLADTLAASVSATNVILLGDPQQLPQVAQASHPNRCGVSALEHLLGEGVRTFPPERGVLLDVTWRMHPDVCDFISEVMYEGRLTSHPSCALQTTAAAGTGLRWIRAQHTGRSTESPEEAAIVAATIQGLLGTDWTDQDGATRPLTAQDVIVVTPYNDQRRLITSVLQAQAATAGVEVGTVDKFQGREAAVVLFSMTTSSAEFMPRDANFLFSKNRLNVAISRARCLAYLICTDELLDTRARDVPQMTLISALCAFVERTPVLAHVGHLVPPAGERTGRVRPDQGFRHGSRLCRRRSHAHNGAAQPRGPHVARQGEPCTRARCKHLRRTRGGAGGGRRDGRGAGGVDRGGRVPGLAGVRDVRADRGPGDQGG